MQQQRQHTLALLTKRETLVAVQAKALNVGVELHTVQPQLPQVGNVLRQRHALRVQRPEAVQAVGKLRHLGSDKLVDVLHLLRPRRHRLHKEAVDPRALGKQRLHCAVVGLAEVVIEGCRRSSGLLRDLCGINMAMCVKNLHYRRSNTAIR